MASIKYNFTVDSDTGMITKIERVGDGGEYKEIDLRKLRFDLGNVGGTAIVINIYSGGAAGSAAAGSAGAAASPTGGVKVTDGEDFGISFPLDNPPGRAR
ncbi:MAG: hypothetical protein JOZ33_06825 [Acidobacteriaceae bacterium]|nr:hypothetical protein [Acidobacteriaceae bacterium]